MKICQTAYNELESQRTLHFKTMSAPNDEEVVINDCDMSQEMQDQAVSIARTGMSIGPNGNGDVDEPSLADYITREMENLHGGHWNCVVFKNVIDDGNVFHVHVDVATAWQEGNFIYFCIGDTAILLYKTPVDEDEE